MKKTVIATKRGLIPLAATAMLALVSAQAGAQCLNRTLINDGWLMQDAAEVVKTGPEKGWIMLTSARVPQEGKYVSRADY